MKTYGYADATPIELIKVRVIGRGLNERRFTFEQLSVAHRRAAASSGTRKVSFERGSTPIVTEIVDRRAVPLEPRRGPLLIEEFDSTIVVPPEAQVRRDRLDCIIIEMGAA